MDQTKNRTKTETNKKYKRSKHDKFHSNEQHISFTYDPDAEPEEDYESPKSVVRNNYNKKKPKGSPSQRKRANIDESALLKIIPLGGLDVIGRNMTAFVCNGDMIIDDAGLMFPDDDHPGIDLILPDYSYILQHSNMLRGIFITHGHEDHTGCVPYLLKDLGLDIPIYGTSLTLALIKCKLDEHHIKNAKLVEITPGQKLKMGCFDVEFFSVNHSIPGSVGVFIKTPAGNVLHTGDFKLDQTPVDGVHTDFCSLARFAETGVDLLMSDSTNAQHKDFTRSESEVGVVLNSIISKAKGRVIVAAFASHIHRIQQVCDAAYKNGRKIVVTGRSMVQNVDIARKLGYLNVAEDFVIDSYHQESIPPEQTVILCTGSQGEPLSALYRISTGSHRAISIEEGDTVIISATPVPGNEKAVTRIINNLARVGVDVYDKSRAMVHVSGHAGSEELKIILSMVKPNYFMPVHGESAHLMAHANLAKQVGINEKNIFICDNGDTLELKGGKVKRGQQVECGVVLVDGLSVGDTSEAVLEDRIALRGQGFAVVSAAVSFSRSTLVGDVVLSMRGITGGDDVYIEREAEKVVTGALKNALKKGADKKALEKIAKDSLLSILWERIRQRPMVIVNLIAI
jgi:ribonuclease J